MASIPEKLAAAPVTDSFNRTENPIGAPWVAINPATKTGKAQVGPPIGYTPVTSFAGGEDGAYWSTKPFSVAGGSYIYAIFTLTNIGSSERQTGAWLCRDESNPVANQTGYLLRLERKAGVGEIKFTIEKWTAGVKEVIAELTTTEYVVGSQIALVVGNGKVYMFARKEESGAFVEKLSAASSAYTQGYSGVRAKGTGEFIIKDFRTGTFTLRESEVAVKQSYPPDRLAIEINAPNGYRNRWAEDEPLAANVLSDIVLTDEMPGGDASLTGTLARDPQFNWQDMEAYADIKAINGVRDDVFEGFLDKAPDVTDDQLSINPAALGYQSILEDDAAAAIGFINCDLTKWGPPSTQRLKELLEGGYYQAAQMNIGFQNAGVQGPGIIFDFSGVTTDEKQHQGVEAWFDGEGADIARLMYYFIALATYDTSNETQWIDQGGVCLDDLRTNPVVGNNHHQSTNASVPEYAPPYPNVAYPGSKHAFFYSYHLTGVSGNSMGAVHAWLWPKVIGTTGLTLRGVWPDIGFTAKQMLGYLIPKLASPLEAREEDMDDDGFVVPQAWYGERGKTSDIVHDVTKYGLFDWFVRGGKRFRYKEPGSYGNYWKAYVRDSHLNEVGIDSQRLWRSIVVRYQDVSGQTRYVGPPGSGCNVESSALEITDPDHPAVRANRTRRDILDMKGIGTPATAIEVGLRFLEEAALLYRSGSATLTGYVLDHKGVIWPASCVKSGDWISFVDAADKSYRKIVGRKYSHSVKGAEIDVDAPPSGLEALLERLQAVLVPQGVS